MSLTLYQKDTDNERAKHYYIKYSKYFDDKVFTFYIYFFWVELELIFLLRAIYFYFYI